MKTRLLIDGYNLLFTSGMDGRGRGPRWLQRARERLLVFLHSKLPAEDIPFTVIVFDAATRPFHTGGTDEAEAASNRQAAQGIQVIFAVDYDEADDLLENMIRRHPAPKSLTVVSSDHRILKCALARRAQALDVDSFLTHLESAAANEESTLQNEKHDYSISPDEVERWLREFGESGES
jgi:uncharacterized protein